MVKLMDSAFDFFKKEFADKICAHCTKAAQNYSAQNVGGKMYVQIQS